MALDVTYIGCERPEDREFVDRHLVAHLPAVLGRSSHRLHAVLVRVAGQAMTTDRLDDLVYEQLDKSFPGTRVVQKGHAHRGVLDGYVFVLIDDEIGAGWTYLSEAMIAGHPSWLKISVSDLFMAILNSRLKTLIATFDTGSDSTGGE